MNVHQKNSVTDLADEEERTIEFKTPVKGHDFGENYTLISFIQKYSQIGFQATNLCLAIDEIRRMLGKNLLFNLKTDPTDVNTIKEEQSLKTDIDTTKEVRNLTQIYPFKRSKIFFGCTSNMISSGLRETICFLAKNKYIDVFITTAGGIEEDLIKCLKDTFLAKFELDGKMLRQNGYNRIGNLVIPNENYCSFETWLRSILDKILNEHTNLNHRFEFQCCSIEERDDNISNSQNTCKNVILTPSGLIKILGSFINDESSILYWCAKNGIPVYCPAITDGSLGDILTFYKDRQRIKLDVVKDIHDLNMESMNQETTGAIILGSGVVKHSILNANLFRDGADYTVLLNNASEFDGSDAGANISEAVSWGKSKGSGVKVFGDATIHFPLITAAAFYEK